MTASLSEATSLSPSTRDAAAIVAALAEQAAAAGQPYAAQVLASTARLLEAALAEEVRRAS